MNDNASQTESEHRSRSFNRYLLDGGNGEHLRQESFLGIHTLQCLFMYEACINIQMSSVRIGVMCNTSR